MKNVDQEQKNKNNERIIFLLAELNSTLDLYYEPIPEKQGIKMDRSIPSLNILNQ